MLYKSLAVASALILTSNAVSAQSLPARTQADTAPYTLSTNGKAPRAFPGVFGVPAAFIAPGGSAFASLKYTNPRGGVAGRGGDADISLGFGVGNPINSVGLNFGADITGTQPFADTGSFSVTAARALKMSPNNITFGSLGVSSLGGWGTSKGASPKYTATVSHYTQLGQAGNRFPLMVSAGYAAQNTYSTTAIGQLSDGVFAGVGLGVTPNLSVSASATQTQLNLGASMTIPGLKGVAFSAGYHDVVNTVQRRQMSFTISVAKRGLFGK